MNEPYMTVHEMVSELRQDMRELRIEVTQIKQSMGLDVADLATERDKIADHEKRVRSLERWRYGIPVGLIAGFIANFTNHS